MPYNIISRKKNIVKKFGKFIDIKNKRYYIVNEVFTALEMRIKLELSQTILWLLDHFAIMLIQTHFTRKNFKA